MMKIETTSGKVYKEDKFEDPYYRLFLSNTSLRESCFQCPSRGLHERADITLSDFWGVENISPDLIDGGGLSLVIAHSDKGQEAFERIRNKCVGHEVIFDEAIKGNPTFFESYQRPLLRDSIEKDIDIKDIGQLDWKYTLNKKGKVKRILQKIGLYNVLKKLQKLIE